MTLEFYLTLFELEPILQEDLGVIASRELQYTVNDYFLNDPVGSAFSGLEGIVNPEIERILFNGADIQTTLDNLATKLDRKIDGKWK